MARNVIPSKGVRVKVHPEAISDFLRANKPVRDLLMGTARDVAAEAQATASEAEKGAGGRIDGYAEAGFSVVWQGRTKRPRIDIRSNADGKTATAAHFHTQRVNGVGHLRAALYKFTRRG